MKPLQYDSSLNTKFENSDALSITSFLRIQIYIIPLSFNGVKLSTIYHSGIIQ